MTAAEVRRAYAKVNRALGAGSLVQTPCVVCGESVVQAHHPNGYDAEHALDVVWLCQPHHNAIHHPRVILPLGDAAKMLGLAESTLRHQIKNGKLQARKVSRDWYLTPEEVERYRLQNRRPAQGV